jgi:peptidyl-prolyl cis-trans isomerase D
LPVYTAICHAPIFYRRSRPASTLPRPVVETLYRYRGEKRLADIVGFPVAGVKDVGQPSDADLTKFYEAHPDLFRAPEHRAFTVASLAPEDVVKPGEIPENKVREEYEQRKDEFETPEQRDVQQILAPSEEKAKEAQAALDAGKDWKEVATTIAKQDPESIDLGMMKRQDLPQQLAEVVFELPLNRPSDPIKTPARLAHPCASSRSNRPRRRASSRPKPQTKRAAQQEGSTSSKSSATRSMMRSRRHAARRRGRPIRPQADDCRGGRVHGADPGGKPVALPRAKRKC